MKPSSSEGEAGYSSQLYDGQPLASVGEPSCIERDATDSPGLANW